MIFANASWGEWLEKKKVAGIYRSQRMGKVKMTSVPGPHDGIGVEYYAWSTSPLRRYVDMVNQRQLIAAVRDEKPRLRLMIWICSALFPTSIRNTPPLMTSRLE